jgi:hypothetical protein
MPTVSSRIKENDVVELRKRVGDWPSGRIGAVVSEQGAWKLIEIADDRGQMLDLISVSESDLRLIEKYSD